LPCMQNAAYKELKQLHTKGAGQKPNSCTAE